MPITVNIYYTGEAGAARAFAEEMLASGTVDAIRAEEGNLRYEYFMPLENPETVLLIDQWANQAALDAHHASPMMERIAQLREKYDLHMRVERFVSVSEEAFEDEVEATRFAADLAMQILDGLGASADQKFIKE